MNCCDLRKPAFLALVIVFAVFVSQARAAITIESQVAAEEDDAEENLISGDMESLTSSDLELGLERVPDDGEGVQLVGIRFPDVQIPPKATIISAAIQFTVDEDDKGPAPANYGIFGELSLDAAQFTTDNSNISDRTATSAVVPWVNVPSWTGQVGQAGPDQRTPDIATIVQEIVDQSGWTAGNAMAFGIAPIDLSSGDIDLASEANRTAESYDPGHTLGPRLHVEFVPEPSSLVLAMFGIVMLCQQVSRRTRKS